MKFGFKLKFGAGKSTATAVTFTEYFVSDGIGGHEQANDSAAAQLFVKE